MQSEERYSEVFWNVGQKLLETKDRFGQEEYEKWITHNPLLPRTILMDFPLLLTTFEEKYKKAARRRENQKCRQGVAILRKHIPDWGKVRPTRAQLLAIVRLRAHWWCKGFRVVFMSDYIGCECGNPAMFIGIEKDGYTHS